MPDLLVLSSVMRLVLQNAKKQNMAPLSGTSVTNPLPVSQNLEVIKPTDTLQI